MNAQEIRDKFMARKRRVINFDGSLPDLEELDGQLAFQEVKGSDLDDAEELAIGPDGKTQDITMAAAMVARSLVTREEPRERIFSDLDVEAVAGYGFTVLKPLQDQAAKVSGIGKAALTTAKKNSETTQNTASPTPLPES